MAIPHLKLVDDDSGDRCGGRTRNGTPCMRRTGGGRCHDHADSPAAGPAPPEYLGEYGKQEWARRMDELASAGVIGGIDIGLLESLCDVYDELRSAKKDLGNRGREIPGQRGTMKKNPAVSVWNRCRKEYRLHVKDLQAQMEELRTNEGAESSEREDTWTW